MTIPTLTRVLKPGVYGKDVQGVRRACRKFTFQDPPTAPLGVQRSFNASMTVLVKAAQDQAVLPKSGWVGPQLMSALRRDDAFDAYAEQLLEQYEEEQKPKWVEPRQGWDSLHKSLWGLFSQGRSMGLSDLGTYNPASTLPGGGRSDHAVYPALAFDLGVDPDTGFQNPVGRKFFGICVKNPNVEYVILGTKIWSESQGLHEYTSGGHANHVHVSGHR